MTGVGGECLVYHAAFSMVGVVKKVSQLAASEIMVAAALLYDTTVVHALRFLSN
jgi:hypothetical protein